MTRIQLEYDMTDDTDALAVRFEQIPGDPFHWTLAIRRAPSSEWNLSDLELDGRDILWQVAAVLNIHSIASPPVPGIDG